MVLVVALAALMLGSFARMGADTTQAAVDDTLTLSCEFLIDGIDGDTEDVSTPLGADGAAACDSITEAEVAALAGDLDMDGSPGETTPVENGIGDNDGVLELSDFDDLDLDDNQVTDEGTAPKDSTYIFAFVDDDERVTFDAQDGGTITVNDDGGTDDGTPAPEAPTDNPETCDGNDDEDCGTTVTTDGDGVVVATFTETTDVDGDTNEVDVFQADDTGAVSTEVIKIMGAADEVELNLVEEVMQTSEDSAACTEDADASDGTNQLGDIDKTVAIATVTDNDGDDLTRVTVLFEVDGAIVIDTSESAEDTEPSFDSGVSVDAGDAGIAAFAVICADEDPGEGTLTATINDGTPGEESSEATIQVVGTPDAVALTASPAIIDCNGTATSTVTATVTDADGNEVANGTNVNFSVVALGTSNPINADTVDGVASSVITPLSNAVAGVTVIVTAGESGSEAQASIRVDCNAPAAQQTPGGPVASPTRPGGIGGPDTGSGGYAGEDSAGFPMWTLLALVLGSVALVGGGLVTRRVGK
jgi:hypothetical protein